MTAPGANAADRALMLRVLGEHEMVGRGVPALPDHGCRLVGSDCGCTRVVVGCTGCEWVTEADGGQGEAFLAHQADALAAAGFVGPGRVAALEAELTEARALLRRVLDGRVRHDHAYPMEVGPHHCDGCDLFDEIAAFTGPTVASPDGVPISEVRARLDALARPEGGSDVG